MLHATTYYQLHLPEFAPAPLFAAAFSFASAFYYFCPQVTTRLGSPSPERLPWKATARGKLKGGACMQTSSFFKFRCDRLCFCGWTTTTCPFDGLVLLNLSTPRGTLDAFLFVLITGRSRIKR
jgi:hypothetical protein